MAKWAIGQGFCCSAALLLCGCTLLDSFGLGDSHAPAAAAHPACQATDPHAQHGVPSALDHPPPLQPQQGGGEQIAYFSERLAATEDDRKILAARLQQLQGLLIEKDQALAMAMGEVQEATAQITRTRGELQAWKREMAKLRDKAGSAEKDSKATLESVIRTLEEILEREPAASRGPREVLPEPRRVP